MTMKLSRRAFLGRAAAAAGASPMLWPASSLAAGTMALRARRPFPAEGGFTSMLDPADFLTQASLDRDGDHGWYRNNIPFFDCPDAQGGAEIRRIYYYRWRVIKNHMRHTRESGHVFTEFLDGDSWRARDPFLKRTCSTINAAAGHIIDDIRWLRDGRYARDYINHFLGGYGRLLEYTDWIGDAVYRHALATGDHEFARGHLPRLVSVYTLRKALEFDRTHGLFHTRPMVDAMETNSTAQQHGEHVRTFRPTYAGYMFGYARAISGIARWAGDELLQIRYAAEAEALRAALHETLWNAEAGCFMEKLQDGRTWAPALELLGLIPWAFHMPFDREPMVDAWRHVIDTNTFNGPHGLRTLAKDGPFYFNGRGQNTCRWDGPSWPFTTSHILAGMANVLNDHEHHGVLSPDIFHDQLLKFTRQHYKDGAPHLAESFNPDTGVWWCDIPNRSEDYLHSKYVDLIITGLVGLRPGGEQTVVNPLIPAGWDHFCLEHVPYHGRDVTIVYDGRASGQRYRNRTAEVRPGLTVYVDGDVRGHAARLGPLCVTVKRRAVALPESDANYAFRDYRFIGTQGHPGIEASVQGGGTLHQVLDGTVLYYAHTPRNRFTFEGSPNDRDHIIIDLGEDQPIHEVKVCFYDDGHALRCPTSYDIAYAVDAAPDRFMEVRGMVASPAAPAANAVHTCAFPMQRARKWRIRLVHAGEHRSAVCEMELNGPRPRHPAPYRDHFADNRPRTEASGWISYGGAWCIRDNKRFGVDKGGECKAVLALNTGNHTNYGNLDYSADMYMEDAAGQAGLLFRVSEVADGIDSFKGWYAGVEAGKLILGHSDGKTFTRVAEKPVEPAPNKISRLRVQYLGADGREVIRVYFNADENPVIDHEDKKRRYRSGCVGVRACGTAAEFAHIRVDERPSGGGTLAVPSRAPSSAGMADA